MKFNIAFYCESIPFTDKTIRLETSLGGSESALIGIAEELAALGHEVTIFTQIDDPAHRQLVNGVQWYDIRDEMPALLRSVEWDIFISLRIADVFAKRTIRAKYKAIWCQDELIEANPFLASIWSVDEIYYVSNWQRQHYEGQLPDTVQKMGFVTKNGIDLGRIDKAIGGIEKIPSQLIYISRPERGLEPLLQIFPKIRAVIPEVTLKVCRYYSMYEPNPNVKAICDWADRAIEQTEGVEYLGNLSKPDLYRAIAESELMVYPGIPDFNETSCIAALEAQACQTPLICSNKGGLRETLHDNAGVKLDGDAFSEAYQTAFVNEVCDLLSTSDDKSYADMQAQGRQWVEKNYQFRTIAKEWDKHFHRFFNDRFLSNVQAVYRNLVHHDDMVAAGKVAQQYGFLERHRALQTYRDETETPQAYSDHAMTPDAEYGAGRFHAVLDLVADIDPSARILDFACGNGTMARHFAERYTSANLTCIDYSQPLCQVAKTYLADLPNAVEVRHGSLDVLRFDERFDLIFCGEYLEHTLDPRLIVDALTHHLTENGVLVWTVPHGPMAEYAQEIAMHGHRVHFELNTINELFSQKENFAATYFSYDALTPRGSRCAHWLIRHGKGGDTGDIDWTKKYTLTRPYPSLSVCMITKDEETNLAKCLASVKAQADEIIVADMESTDETVNIAKRYGATIKPLPSLCPDVPPDTPPPGSFEWARNESVKDAKGDWILWIDADEELLAPHTIRKYLESRCFDGFAIRQNHLELDAPGHYDTPVRLYRNDGQFKFYGYIHEHAMKSLNEPIEPALELTDCQIAHYGYVIETRRRAKCESRNMHLLSLDRQVYPDRHLGQVLLAREYLNFIHWDIADGNAALLQDGQLHPACVKQRDYAQRIVGICDKFSDSWRPAMMKTAWHIYQDALKFLGVGRLTDIVKADKLESVRYRDIRELDAYLRDFQWQD